MPRGDTHAAGCHHRSDDLVVFATYILNAEGFSPGWFSPYIDSSNHPALKGTASKTPTQSVRAKHFRNPKSSFFYLSPACVTQSESVALGLFNNSQRVTSVTRSPTFANG